MIDYLMRIANDHMISFEKLDNIRKIGEGGFGSVFSAIWIDGTQPPLIVALKTFKGNSFGILKEFSIYKQTRCKLKIYGLTQNTETSEYFMVFQYANNGNLYNFSRKNFQNLTWEIKLKLLRDISDDLYGIHEAGYIHADLHSGNVLLDKDINLQAYISDLGLSKKNDEKDSDNIYGVMLYVAPEILSGDRFTKAADIYSFGIIMIELSIGQKLFDFDFFDFRIRICDWLKFPFCASNYYVELLMQCIDPAPQKRPTALEVNKKLEEINHDIFYEADKIIKKLLVNDSSDSSLFIDVIDTQEIYLII